MQLHTEKKPALSRRCAMLGAAWPLTGQAAAHSGAAPFIRRADEANNAFIRGDMRAWYALVGPIAQDFTLMQPFGGSATHGFDGSPAHLDQMAQRFRDGVGEVEVVQTYVTRDMVVLAFVERQRGEVGALPMQDWSLRVTQVWRRKGQAWELVHRHADPLTRNLGLERTAAIARGEG